jgi:IclR family transcriptional regulator, mhp operon transcriptional activator
VTTPGEGRLVDCAAPHMIELTHRIGWVCDLHIFERTHSRIIESTRPISPFFQYNRPIDMHVTVFGSAAGLAVLSTWTDAAILTLVKEIGDDPVWGLRRAGLTRRDLFKFVQQVRASGFASRPRPYLGGTPMANKMSAIACPIFRAHTAVGALALLWPRELATLESFVKRHLHTLMEATANISVDLAAAR